jgi:hypothetical protein
MNEFQLLTLKEASKLLGVSTVHLRALSVHGEISYVNVGLGEREIRRYRLSDVKNFIAARTRTDTVKWSTRPPLEVTDDDLKKAARMIARDRRKRERAKEQAEFQEHRRLQREAQEKRRKAFEEEALHIRQRLWLETIYGKGKVPPHML